MKRPPTNPRELQAKSMDLLCQGILEGKPYERLNAFGEVVKGVSR